MSAALEQAEGEALEAFRKLLEQAEDDDGARSELLDELIERTMHVACWAGTPEALRTLSNAKGERALALFSGRDVLGAVAAQLGWTGADGSLPARAVDAHEVLEAGLSQGVEFVVIDLGTDQALELARDELSLFLAVTQKRSSKVATTAQAKTGLVDMDLPFDHRRTQLGAAPAATSAKEDRGVELTQDALSRAFAAPVADGPGSSREVSAPVVAPQPLQPPPAAAPPAAWTPIAEASPVKASAGASPGEGERVRAPKAANKTLAGMDDKASAPKPAAKAPVEEDKAGGGIMAAARKLKTMIGTGEAAAAAAAAPAVPPGEEGAGAGEQVFAEGALRPLELGLSEATLVAIAEALRGFPEVEWACEVSDGTEVPVLGVRVSPQFMTRAGDVSAAVSGVATGRGVELRVLLLSEAALMREARTHGTTFYPWRKRK